MSHVSVCLFLSDFIPGKRNSGRVHTAGTLVVRAALFARNCSRCSTVTRKQHFSVIFLHTLCLVSPSCLPVFLHLFYFASSRPRCSEVASLRFASDFDVPPLKLASPLLVKHRHIICSRAGAGHDHTEPSEPKQHQEQQSAIREGPSETCWVEETAGG